MKGSHQVGNAALALMGIMYLKTYLSFLMEEEHIERGLSKHIGLAALNGCKAIRT